MKPYFKVLVVAENATDLKNKCIELAQSFGADKTVQQEKEVAIHIAPIKEAKFDLKPEVAQAPVESNGKAWVPHEAGGFVGKEIGEEKDSVGMPWDARIHVDSKAVKKDGTWINRRGLDKDFLASVEAELRGAKKDVPPFGSMSVPQYNEAVAFPVAPAPVAPPVVAPVPAMPAPVVEQPMGIAAGHTVETFKKNLPLILMELTNAKKITPDYIKSLNVHFGVKELVDVVGDDKKINDLFNAFIQYKFINAI